MTLYRENPPDSFSVWSGEPIGGVRHPPEIESAWTASELAAIKLFVPAPAERVPDGKGIVSTSVRRIDGAVRFVHVLEDVPAIRRMVRKSTVQTRLIEAGLMRAALLGLTSNPVFFARWFAPDQPQVYADDADALLFLKVIGADVAVVMAEDV